MEWFEEYKKLVFSKTTSLVEIERALALKFENLPSILYKYREINEYSLKNLEEDSIWLSDPENFNDLYDCSFKMKTELDPYDSEIVIDMAIEAGLINRSNSGVVELIRNSKNPTTTLMEHCYPDKPEYGRKAGEALSAVLSARDINLVSEVSDSFKKMFKVCSFSEKPNSMLMWSHYAKYHTGFCVAYNFQDLGNKDMRTRLLCPIIYSEEMFDASEFFSKNRGIKNVLYMNQAALIKSKEWSYEKEWRLVFGNMSKEKETSFAVPAPNFVLLGTKIPKSDEKKIRNICNKKNVEVKKMQISATKYKLSSS